MKDPTQVAVTKDFSDGARQYDGCIGPLDVDHRHGNTDLRLFMLNIPSSTIFTSRSFSSIFLNAKNRVVCNQGGVRFFSNSSFE